jgi:hypothetical protein
MSRQVLVLAAVLSLLAASGCGYLDEDIHLSEQDFAESFGMSGTAGSFVGTGVGTSVGCGIGGGYASYTRHMLFEPTVIQAALPEGRAGEGRARGQGGARKSGPDGAAGYDYARHDEDKPRQKAQLHTGLETWGQYLEAELESAR